MWAVRDLEEVLPSRDYVNFLLPASVTCWYLFPGKKNCLFNLTSGKYRMLFRKFLMQSKPQKYITKLKNLFFSA